MLTFTNERKVVTHVGIAVKKLNKKPQLFNTKFMEDGKVLIGVPFENNIAVVDEIKQLLVGAGFTNPEDIIGNFTYMN